jgi:parallel beta-helix repeat protein
MRNKSFKKKKATTVIVLTQLLLGLFLITINIKPAKTEPSTITVPDDYPTIQEAINAANPGDTIMVATGTYLENIVVNKTVTLIGEDSNNTIIDGGDFGTVILVIANNVSISKFTIKNSGSTLLDNGILINQASYCNVSNNILTSNYFGIRLKDSSNNVLSNNNVTDNQYGIELFYSSNNVLTGNRMARNQFNFGVWGSTLSHYIHDIETSNFVNDKPVYYWVNKHRTEVPPDAGYIALINSTEITAKNLALTNNGAGIQIAYTENSSITNNNLTNNLHGIWLLRSSNNALSNNNVTDNQYGIWLLYSSTNTLCDNNVTDNHYGIGLEDSSNNTIYHNKFVNTLQISNNQSINIWDNSYPSGGNYWSDYTGVDLKSGLNQDQPGSDGIGDTSYAIDANNTDRYPLMNATAIHNIAITNITTSKTIVGQGFNLYMKVEAENKGNCPETVNVTVYITTTIITQTVNLTIGTTTLTFTWNTTGFAKGNYTINAYAWPVPGETDTGDNSSAYGGVIIVTVPGDTDGDRDIDIYDIVRLASAYGAKRGEARFNPNCDIDSNDVINIYDVVIATSRYGYKET